jgi:hypothetical protein
VNEPSVLTSSHLAGVDGGLSSDEIYSSQAFVTDTSRYTLLPAHPTSAVTDTCTTVPTTGRLLYLSKKNLQTIKDESTDRPNPDSWIMTFDALSAYSYQAVHRARRRLRENQYTIPPLSRLDFWNGRCSSQLPTAARSHLLSKRQKAGTTHLLFDPPYCTDKRPRQRDTLSPLHTCPDPSEGLG